jgi:hypothetical protein
MAGLDGRAPFRTVAEARILEKMLVSGFAEAVLLRGERDAPLLIARQALADCRLQGLPFAQSADGARTYDPVETWNFISLSGARGDGGFWRDHCVASRRREIRQDHPGAADGDEPPPPPDRLRPARYAVRVGRTFNLAGRRPGEQLRLRLPLPIEDPAHTDVQVDIDPLPLGAIRSRREAGRLDVLVAAPSTGEVRLGWRAVFTACATLPDPTAALGDEDRALYTRPSEGLIRVADRIRALAEELAGDEADAWAIVRRFWIFIHDTLACGSIPYDQLDPARPLDWALDHGWFDCKTGSALIVALCRARAIPARLVGGYLLSGPAPAFHTWLEAWVDGRGWSPLDLTSWALSLGGRDGVWRDYFLGQLDHRLVVERPPRLFAGTGAVRLPTRWRLLMSLTEHGARATFEDADTGAWTYHEDMELERLDA